MMADIDTLSKKDNIAASNTNSVKIKTNITLRDIGKHKV